MHYDRKYMKIGQLQWILFFISLIDPKFYIIWVISLFLDNKEQ